MAGPALPAAVRVHREEGATEVRRAETPTGAGQLQLLPDAPLFAGFPATADGADGASDVELGAPSVQQRNPTEISESDDDLYATQELLQPRLEERRMLGRESQHQWQVQLPGAPVEGSTQGGGEGLEVRTVSQQLENDSTSIHRQLSVQRAISDQRYSDKIAAKRFQRGLSEGKFARRAASRAATLEVNSCTILLASRTGLCCSC